MQPAGLQQVEQAKANGRWGRAYAGSRSIVMTPELAAALVENSQTKAFYDTLSRTQAYSFLWRLQTAPSPEVCDARTRKFIGMLERHQVL